MLTVTASTVFPPCAYTSRIANSIAAQFDWRENIDIFASDNSVEVNVSSSDEFNKALQYAQEFLDDIDEYWYDTETESAYFVDIKDYTVSISNLSSDLS